MGETVKLTMKVQGEFITQLAREQFYYESRFEYAIELLCSCLQCDQLSKDEIINLAMAILDGRAEIHGTYPGDDYGVRYLEKRDPRWDLSGHVKKLCDQRNRYEEEVKELRQKYLFVVERLTHSQQVIMNGDYKEEYGEVLFEDLGSTIATSGVVNPLLESYIKRQKDARDDDYGWLEPNGTFHAVEWGEHQVWADHYLEEHLSEEEYDKYYLFEAGDYLTEHGWILLHSPSQGIAYITRDNSARVTKAQKEFLYQYYIDRDCHKEANDVMEL